MASRGTSGGHFLVGRGSSPARPDQSTVRAALTAKRFNFDESKSGGCKRNAE